jgi:glycosyltransferase involved in cell wall biosynthesis
MNTAQLKIAVIGLRGYPSDYSGLERVAEELYPALAANGHEITIFSRDKSPDREDHSHQRISIIATPFIPIPSLETLTHAFFSFVYLVSRTKRPDVIYFQALAPGSLSALCRIFKTPCVVSIQGLDWQRAKWKGIGSLVLRISERLVVRFATEIIVVSHELQQYYDKKYHRSTHLISNAIDFPKQNEAGEDQTFGLPEGCSKGYILCCSRLVPEKRIGDVIRAFRNMGTEYALVILGKGPGAYTKRLRDLAAGDPRIFLAGHKRREQTREWIRHAHVMVSASELEGMPLSLIEAIAMGIPVIASSIAPHRELFKSIDNIFFDPGDVVGLQRKIELVLANHFFYKSQAEILKGMSSYQNVGIMTDRITSVLVTAKDKKIFTRV